MTASAMYNRAPQNGNWASTVAWGRTRSLTDNVIQNSYLLESTLRFAEDNYVWTRIENVDRTTELLLGENRRAARFSAKSQQAGCRPTPSATTAISICYRIGKPQSERKRPSTRQARVCNQYTEAIRWALPFSYACVQSGNNQCGRHSKRRSDVLRSIETDRIR